MAMMSVPLDLLLIGATIKITFISQSVVPSPGGIYLSPTSSKSNRGQSYGGEGFRLNSDDSSG
jgi:hypothetical protein